MYGLCEKWLADILEIDNERFELNDSSVAAIINKDDFEKLCDSLHKVWEEDGDIPEMVPTTVNSDVQGLKIIIHKYWANITVLDGLTSGETKESLQYISVREVHDGEGRCFDGGKFKEQIRRFFGVESDTADADEPQEEQEPEQVETIGVDFLNFIKSTYASTGDDLTGKTGKVVRAIGQPGIKSTIDLALELAEKIGRNIIILSGLRPSQILSAIKKKFNVSDVLEHTIFLSIEPGLNPDFVLPTTSNSIESVCFGEKMDHLYCVQGTLSKILDSIRSDESISREERVAKEKEVKESHKISVYSKYDSILKDHHTNIVWAVRDRCFINLLFPNVVENKDVLKVCMKELARRFDKTIPIYELKKIDKQYHDGIAGRNMEKYIDFAVESAENVLKQIEKLYKDAQEEYEKAIKRAREKGKMANKYAYQLHSFDKKRIYDEKRNEALQAYQDTINIPEVLSVSIEGDSVHVYTKNLYAQDERSKKWHDIGTFHIKLGMLSNAYDTGNTVTIMNTKHQIDGFQQNMQAPHVYGSGSTCHGNLSTIMTQAYAKGDLFTMIQQLIIFLQDANTDDSAGSHINKWPQVTEEVAKGKQIEEKEKTKETSAAESKFDNILADAIPVHI